MLRRTLLYLSNQQQIFEFVRKNRLAKGFARRFVAGETLEEALDAVVELNARGITASLDLLGESVNNESEARQAGREYLHILDRIHERKLDANVSVKLTAMGLDISEELCVGIMHDILGRARDYRTFVRLDMESSQYTDQTLRIFEQRLFPAYPAHVGIVLQSYLYRTQADCERANEIRARVRICKGAYKEPATVAYPEKRDVDANYVRCMQLLMEKGNYPGIATHDEAIIAEVEAFQRRKDSLQSRIDLINQLKQNQKGPVRIMDRISQDLPDLVWLDKMTVAAGLRVDVADARRESRVVHGHLAARVRRVDGDVAGGYYTARTVRSGGTSFIPRARPRLRRPRVP